MERKSNRLLLVGKDSIFAWALEQKITLLEMHLEHVYTLGEAQLRLKRFDYAAVMADGLKRKDVELLAQDCSPQCTLFFFDDINLETPVSCRRDGTTNGVVVVPKECALPFIVASLAERV